MAIGHSDHGPGERPPRKMGSICPPRFVHAFIHHLGTTHETGKSNLRPASQPPSRQRCDLLRMADMPGRCRCCLRSPAPTAVDAVMNSRHRAARLAFALFVITTGVNLQAPLYAAMARQDGVGLTATTVAFSFYVAG